VARWGAALAGILFVVAWLLWHYVPHGLLLVAFLAIGGAAAGTSAWNWLVPGDPKNNYVGKAAGTLLGYFVAHFHLRFFDPEYLERGRLQRLLNLR
jgi:hypothetical protein